MSNIAENYWKFYNPQYPLNVMVIGKTKADRNYYVNRRCSHIMAIEYITKGSETLIINSKKYRPSKNDTVLLTKGSRHEYFCSNDSVLEKEWIVFDGVLAKHLIDIYIPDDEYCFAGCDLSQYFNEINNIKKLYSKSYEKMLDSIAVVLHKMFIKIKNSRIEYNYSVSEQIQKYLDSNIEKKITIDDLCKVFNYSKNQIIKVFRDSYDITPYHYFLERKIDVAKLYLSNTKYSISEISHLLAFSDQNYFSSQFRKLTGLSPSQYRKQVNSDYSSLKEADYVYQKNDG